MNCYGNYHAFGWLGASTTGIEPHLDAHCACGKVQWKDYKNDPEALVADIVAWREELNRKYPTKVFWDSEFTGLHQGTTLISIGMVAETGAQFYSEMTDYDVSQVDEWIFEHVIDRLWCQRYIDPPDEVTYYLGRTEAVAKRVRAWLEDLGPVEMWGDVLGYDWVLFCELFGGAQKIPSNVYYIPFDLATKLKEYGLDPDLDREAYAGNDIPGPKHNALHDALVIQACYNKLETPLPEFSNEMRRSE